LHKIYWINSNACIRLCITLETTCKVYKGCIVYMKYVYVIFSLITYLFIYSFKTHALVNIDWVIEKINFLVCMRWHVNLVSLNMKQLKQIAYFKVNWLFRHMFISVCLSIHG